MDGPQEGKMRITIRKVVNGYVVEYYEEGSFNPATYVADLDWGDVIDLIDKLGRHDC